MVTLVRAELRFLARGWPCWWVLPMVVVAGWLLRRPNAEGRITYHNFDPQGLDQQLDEFHADLWATFTSGLGVAQFAVLLVGAFLVLRDDPLVPLVLHDPPVPPRPGRELLAKAAGAAVFGLVVALVDIALMRPGAAGLLAGHWVAESLRREGADPGLLTPPAATTATVLACAAVSVALAGVAGVGIAAMAGRWWPVLVAVCSAVPGSLLWLVSGTPGRGEVITVLLALPALPWRLSWFVLLDDTAPAGLALMGIGAGTVLLLGFDNTRRRLRASASRTG